MDLSFHRHMGIPFFRNSGRQFLFILGHTFRRIQPAFLLRKKGQGVFVIQSLKPAEPDRTQGELRPFVHMNHDPGQTDPVFLFRGPFHLVGDFHIGETVFPVKSGHGLDVF